jgi:hypothetical protein
MEGNEDAFSIALSLRFVEVEASTLRASDWRLVPCEERERVRQIWPKRTIISLSNVELKRVEANYYLVRKEPLLSPRESWRDAS